MVNLRKYRLGEFLQIEMGQSPGGSFCNKKSEGVPLLNGPTEFGSKYPTPVQYTTDPKRIARKGDILFCVRGSTTGRMNIADQQYAIGRGLAAIRHKAGIQLQSFAKAVIDISLSKLLNEVTGSTFPNLSKGQLNLFKIEIPADLPTQSRIASILSSLDDKIELNRRMNQTLEQMAQALFNHYFVYNIDPDNLPEGWRWGKLGELISLTYGKALKEEQRKGGIFPVVGSSGIVGYHNESIGLKNGIVVGRKGNAGSVIWMHDAFFPIDTTFYVSDLLKIEGFYFYYFLLKKLNLKSLNSDSAVPGLNRNEAHAQEIVIPERTKIAQFNNSAKILFEKIKVNETEIKTLALIRDTLLPNLMSGEIDVDKVMDEEQLIENELADFKTA
jgi:type I restriction enzyme S subunit